jgi:hypothetical protein
MSLKKVADLAAKYIKQPSTQQGLNVLAVLAAAKYGVPLETVLGLGALASSVILILQDETKGEPK